MIYIITALILVFIAGFLTGKSGRLYFYVNGELHTRIGEERYTLWVKELGIFGAELFGVDYTDGVLSPVYRPTVRFIRSETIWLVGLRIGDFSEVSLLLSTRHPFIRVKYEREVHYARSIDE